jgi:hypothetical protein
MREIKAAVQTYERIGDRTDPSSDVLAGSFPICITWSGLLVIGPRRPANAVQTPTPRFGAPAQRKHVVLHHTKWFDPLSMIVVPFRSLDRGVVQHGHGDQNMPGITDGDGGRRAVAKQMWTQGLAEVRLGSLPQRLVEALLAECRTGFRDPQPIPGRPEWVARVAMARLPRSPSTRDAYHASRSGLGHSSGVSAYL